jgi:DNA-directed RNA polymerase subunit RPC12/RpoP
MLLEKCHKCGQEFILESFNAKQCCDECLIRSVHKFKPHHEKMGDYVKIDNMWIHKRGRTEKETITQFKEWYADHKG